MDKLLIRALGGCQRGASWVRVGQWCAVIPSVWLLNSCLIPGAFIRGGQAHPGVQLVLAELGSFAWSCRGGGWGAGEAAWLQEAPGTPARWVQRSCCTAGGKAECLDVLSLSTAAPCHGHGGFADLSSL